MLFGRVGNLVGFSEGIRPRCTEKIDVQGRDEAGANNEITLKNILDEERYTSYAKVS